VFHFFTGFIYAAQLREVVVEKLEDAIPLGMLSTSRSTGVAGLN
jgi:hypothetical protein